MIHWVHGRLRAWGEWVQMGRGMGSRGLSAKWDGVGGGGQAGAVIPVQDLEASRTDDWVRTRDQAEQALLLQVYCTPSTAVESAATLRISLRTMYSRLHLVHVAYASRTGPAPVPVNAPRAAAPRVLDQSARVEFRLLEVLRGQLRLRNEYAKRSVWPLGDYVRVEHKEAIRRSIALLRTCRPAKR